MCFFVGRSLGGFRFFSLCVCVGRGSPLSRQLLMLQGNKPLTIGGRPFWDVCTDCVFRVCSSFGACVQIMNRRRFELVCKKTNRRRLACVQKTKRARRKRQSVWKIRP